MSRNPRDFTDEQLDQMIEACQAEKARRSQASEPEPEKTLDSEEE